jgi:hypothetical protein
VSQVTAPRHAARASGDGEAPDGLRLAPVVMFGEAAEPARSGLVLVIDRRGVVLAGAGAGERVLPWHMVTGWQVDAWQSQPGATGAVVTYRTLQATYRFGVPGADAAALGYLVEQLGKGYVAGRGRPTPDAAPEPPAVSALEQRVRRLRPVLVVVLVAVLAVMVTLILLQSAGVIHIGLLGGNGSSGPSGLGVHHLARRG